MGDTMVSADEYSVGGIYGGGVCDTEARGDAGGCREKRCQRAGGGDVFGSTALG